MTNAAATTQPPTRPLAVRILRGSGVVLIALLLPALLVGAAFGRAAGLAVPFGVMGGVFSSTGDGRTASWSLMPVVVLGGAGAALTLGTWWWVVLLVLLGLLVGYLSAMNRAVAIIEVGIVVVSSDSVTSTSDLLRYTAFLALGFVLGICIGQLMGAPQIIRKSPLGHIDPSRAALLGAAGLGAAAVLAQLSGWDRAYWLPMLFLILLEFLIIDTASSRMIWYRLLGTLLGIALLVPLLDALPIPVQLAAFVLLIGAGLAVIETLYWLASTFLTAGVVLISALGGNAAEVSQERLWATIWAAALVGGVALALSWVRRPPPKPQESLLVSVHIAAHNIHEDRSCHGRR